MNVTFSKEQRDTIQGAADQIRAVVEAAMGPQEPCDCGNCAEETTRASALQMMFVSLFKPDAVEGDQLGVSHKEMLLMGEALVEFVAASALRLSPAIPVPAMIIALAKALAEVNPHAAPPMRRETAH